MNTWKRLLNRVVYNNDPDLVLSPAKKNMDRFIVQAMLGTAYSTLSGGIFLSGYLLYLGAPDSITSYVPILPSICGIFLIFFSTLLDKRETRKKLLMCVNAMCKVFLISVAFVPMFVPDPYRVPIIFVFLIIGQTIAGVNGIAFNSWFNELIPGQIKGRYFSTRQIFCVLISAVLPVSAGYFVDQMTNQYLAFVILFACAGIVGGIEILMFGRIDDVRMEVLKAKSGIFKAFLMPLQNKPFRMYVLIVCLFHFFLYVAASFSQIYLLRYLHSSFTFINAMSIIASVLQILIFYKFWGKVTDRLGANFVLIASMSLYIIDMLIWMFIDQASLIVLYPLLQIVAAVEGAGFTVGVYTRRYDIIPKEGRSVYDSFFVCCLGVTLLISPFVGGLLRDVFEGMAVFSAVPFGSFRAVYLVAAVTLLGLHIFHCRYARKQNEGQPLFSKERMKQLKLMFMESIGLRR